MMKAPIAINPPLSPAILAALSEIPLDNEIIPPIIIRIPDIMIIMPKGLDDSFLEMKKDIIDKTMGGPPNPIPRSIAFKGKNPFPAVPPPIITSIP